MKILVTGADGFVGNALCSRLSKEKGWKVFAYTIKKYGDLGKPDSIQKAIKGVDVAVNCAGALPHGKLGDEVYWNTNVVAVGNIVAACTKYGVKRLVHISTVGIYGATSVKGIDEKCSVRLTDIYTKTKYEGDQKIWKYIRNGGDAVIIRPTIAYGPGDVRPVFLKLFKMVKKGINISIGDGSNFLHTIYIDNLVEAIYLAVKSKRTLKTDFIIGDGECPTMKEIIATIASVQGKKYVNLVIPKPIGHAVGKLCGMERTVKFVSENRKYSIKKAKKLLGYNPKIGLEEGMQETFVWYSKKRLI